MLDPVYVGIQGIEDANIVAGSAIIMTKTKILVNSYVTSHESTLMNK